MSIIRSLNHLFNSYLSWIVLLMAVLAYLLPTVFSWMTPYIAYMLQFVMFAMGLTLTAQVFLDVFKQPMKVILVSVIQFLWMPLAGFLVALIFNFPPEIGIGFILLGACPGGTASNVMTFLANGNVPLSVSATTVSTLLAPVLTPLFVVLYAGATSSIEIQFMPMFISIVKIVLVPIILGIVLNYFIGSKIEPVKSVCPTIAAIAVLLILAAVTAVNQKQIAETGFIIFVACLVQNVSGYVVTYFVCKALSIDVSSRRAMQIEVAMQNSALSVSLALKHFTPQAAVAGAVFSIIHNFTGSIFAGICRKHDDQEKLENALIVNSSSSSFKFISEICMFNTLFGYIEMRVFLFSLTFYRIIDTISIYLNIDVILKAKTERSTLQLTF